MVYFKVLENIKLWTDMTNFDCEETKVYKTGDIIINVNPLYIDTLKECENVEIGEL